MTESLREMSFNELTDVVSEVLTKWPQFEGVYAKHFCRCGGNNCARDRIREMYGDEAVPAWNRLYEARWLIRGEA